MDEVLIRCACIHGRMMRRLCHITGCYRSAIAFRVAGGRIKKAKSFCSSAHYILYRYMYICVFHNSTANSGRLLHYYLYRHCRPIDCLRRLAHTVVVVVVVVVNFQQPNNIIGCGDNSSKVLVSIATTVAQIMCL